MRWNSSLLKLKLIKQILSIHSQSLIVTPMNLQTNLRPSKFESVTFKRLMNLIYCYKFRLQKRFLLTKKPSLNKSFQPKKISSKQISCKTSNLAWQNTMKIWPTLLSLSTRCRARSPTTRQLSSMCSVLKSCPNLRVSSQISKRKSRIIRLRSPHLSLNKSLNSTHLSNRCAR